MKFIKFSAEWCGPCRAIKPIVERLSSEPKYSSIEFKEINIDEDDDDLSGKYSVRNVPTMLMVDDEGNAIERIVGSVSEASLKQVLDRYI